MDLDIHNAITMTQQFKRIFVIILTIINYTSAKYGGNDIFTSLQAMKRLWIEDRIFVEKLEETISNMKEIIPHMERYE